ncbi:unnamed protein product [Amoebophrya sp. A25]|nr:unnamed protein product [Amoebophrya sp. A25]|eukprot:GSA25T00004904001.1
MSGEEGGLARIEEVPEPWNPATTSRGTANGNGHHRRNGELYRKQFREFVRAQASLQEEPPETKNYNGDASPAASPRTDSVE